MLASLDSRPAAQLRARAHFAAGELRAAETLARILLAQDPRDVRSLALLAEIAAGQGRPDQAVQRLRQALTLASDPTDRADLLERDLHALPVTSGQLSVNLRAHGFAAIRLLR